MAGHKNFNVLRDRMSKERRERNHREAREEMERMLLSGLRRLSGMTQVELAKSLGISQPALSQIESKNDMQVALLRRLIEALGGELEIIAKLPTGRVQLSQFDSAILD